MLKLLVKGQKMIFFFEVLTIVMYGFASLFIAMVFGYNIKQLTTPNFDIIRLIIINISVFLYYIITDGLGMYAKNLFESNVKKNLNDLHFSLLMKSKNIANQESLSSRIITNDIDIIINNYLGSINSLIYFTVTLIIGLAYIFTLNIYFLIFIVIIAFLNMGLSHFFSKKISITQNNLLLRTTKILNNINNYIKNYRIIKFYKIENKIKNKYEIENNNLCKFYYQKGIYTALTTLVNDTSSITIRLGMYILGAILIYFNRVNLPEVISASQASLLISIPIVWAGKVLLNYNSSKEVVKSFFDKVKDNNSDGILKDFNSSIEKIEYKGVSLKYDNKVVVKGLNFIIQKGEKVIINGDSGVGKTTLIKALLTKEINILGDILINDMSITKHTEDYTQKISYVDQNTMLLNDTIQNNITMYKSFDEIKYKKIIDTIYINEILNDKEENYIINANEDNLSGGEKQRISLGRALYHGGEVIVLDEPFANIDTNRSLKILDYIFEVFETVIIISHKRDLEFIEKFNKEVYVE